MQVLENNLLSELPHFEEFFQEMGLKRIEGSIYGLLVLSSEPLSCEEIEKTLKLSQSACSQSLKRLTHFGAIDSRWPEGSRAKVHSAQEDTLSIVATVFRKREQAHIERFRQMSERLLKDKKLNLAVRDKLLSIQTTCEIAESVMNFVIHLAKTQKVRDYRYLTRILPRFFDLMIQIPDRGDSFNHFKGQLTGIFRSGLKKSFSKFSGDIK